eukprot:365325-Chlamydomonas_euryale.AAC.31
MPDHVRLGRGLRVHVMRPLLKLLCCPAWQHVTGRKLLNGQSQAMRIRCRVSQPRGCQSSACWHDVLPPKYSQVGLHGRPESAVSHQAHTQSGQAVGPLREAPNKQDRKPADSTVVFVCASPRQGEQSGQDEHVTLAAYKSTSASKTQHRPTASPVMLRLSCFKTLESRGQAGQAEGETAQQTHTHVLLVAHDKPRLTYVSHLLHVVPACIRLCAGAMPHGVVLLLNLWHRGAEQRSYSSNSDSRWMWPVCTMCVVTCAHR